MVYPFGGSAATMLAVSWAEAFVGTSLVFLRWYAARTHAGKMRWDFIWVALAVVFGIICQICLIWATLNGVGNHLIKVPFPNLWQGLKFTWIGLMLGLPAVTFAKLAIVALLLQVTTAVQPYRRILLWSVGGLVCLVNIVQMALSLTQCDPAPKLWYKLEPGSCPRAKLAQNFGNFQGAVAVGADLFLALYPTTVVWTLKISHRAKIGFCILMAGGLLPAAAGLMRTIYIPRLNVSKDPTYELSPFLTWAITEVWFIIILGCIPPLRPLFERVFRKARARAGMGGGSVSGAGLGGTGPNTANSMVKTIGSKPMEGGFTKTSELLVSVVDRTDEAEEHL